MCTRILWNDNKLAVVLGRNMDWPESTEPILTVFLRGVEHDGGRVGSQVVCKENAAKWVSKYGSMITQLYGLGVHLLYLRATDFGLRDASKPGVHAALWPQYLLDNAATVAEAVALLEEFQVVMVEAHGHKATVHLAIEDAEGDSAIIEYLDGNPLEKLKLFDEPLASPIVFNHKPAEMIVNDESNSNRFRSIPRKHKLDA